MAEVDPKRWDEMASIAATDPSTLFPIILTLKQSGLESSLKESGLLIDHSMQNIVSGKASLECLKKLRSIPGIYIEEDSEYQLFD